MANQAVDTNILIYILTAHPRYGPLSLRLFHSPREMHFEASELVIAELLSHHTVKNDGDIEAVRDFLRSLDLRLVPVTAPVLTEAARLRRHHRLALADAIHLGSAIISGAGNFVTNDQALLGANVAGLTLRSLTDVSK